MIQTKKTNKRIKFMANTKNMAYAQSWN